MTQWRTDFNSFIIVLLPSKLPLPRCRIVTSARIPIASTRHISFAIIPLPFPVAAPRFPNLNPSRDFHSRLIFILPIPPAFDWPRYLHQATADYHPVLPPLSPPFPPPFFFFFFFFFFFLPLRIFLFNPPSS